MRRKLPTRTEILREAQRIELEDITLPSITPTSRELRESGKAYEARLRLMRSPATEGLMEQRRYVDTMAKELKLRVIPIPELRSLRRETGMEWTNGWTRHRKVAPKARGKPQKIATRKRRTRVQIPKRKAVIPTIPKPLRRAPTKLKPKRKRQKNHSRRTAIIPRALRKRIKNGQKSFSFSDDIWKVRKPRRKR